MGQSLQHLYSHFNAFSQFGVTVNDGEGRFLFVNDTFCKIVGYERDELLGQPYTFITHEDDREKNLKMDQLLLDDSIPFFQMKKRYVRQDGRVCPVLLQVTMNKDAQGEFESYFAIITDISDADKQGGVQELGASFRDAISEVPVELQHMITSYELIGRYKQLHARKSSHMAHIVHELRTPLNIIYGVSSRLGKLDPGQAVGDYLDKIGLVRDASKRMSSLVKEILDIEMIESGMFTIHRETMDLSKLLVEVVSFMQPLAQENGLTLSLDYDENSDWSIFADYERLVSVFNNLVSNALKYSNHGVVTVCLVKNNSAASASFSVSVTDQGVGIRDEDMAAIFDEYKQVKPRLKKEVDSMGLGLPIAKKIVEQHDGTISVTSRVGEGSVFTVDLPCSNNGN